MNLKEQTSSFIKMQVIKIHVTIYTKQKQHAHGTHFYKLFLMRSYTSRGRTAYYPPNGATRVIWAERLVAEGSQAAMAANCCPGLRKH